MLIVCPSCASEYTIDPAKLGADGRTLRCAICRDTWFVTPDGQPGQRPAPPPEPTAAPEPPAAAAPSPGRPKRRLVPTRPALAVLGLAGGLFCAWLALAGALPGAGQRLQAAARSLSGWLVPHAPDLAFRGVASDLVQQDGAPVLLVSGEIVNAAPHEVSVPHLEILVRNGEEQVLASWTSPPARSTLGTGETLRFETRLSSPPPDGRQVRVHFTAAGGIAVAARSPDQRNHP